MLKRIASGTINIELADSDFHKYEVSYDLETIYGLFGHLVGKPDFSGKSLFNGGLGDVYINDFAISENNHIIFAGWDQSMIPPLRLYDLKKEKYIWVKVADSKENYAAKEEARWKKRFSCGVLFDAKDNYLYIKFINRLNLILAISGKSIIIYDYEGNLLAEEIVENDIKTYDIFCDKVFIAQENKVLSYKIDVENRKITIQDVFIFDKKIRCCLVLNDTTGFVAAQADGKVFIYRNGIKKCILKECIISVLKLDALNHVVYYGTIDDGKFGVFNYQGEILYQEVIGESIRDILVLCYGKTIFVGCKLSTVVCYENTSITGDDSKFIDRIKKRLILADKKVYGKEITYASIACFEENEAYCSKAMKEFAASLGEKCKQNCSGVDIEECYRNPKSLCLTRIFYEIIPGFNLQPHKGNENGDISGSIDVRGQTYEMIGIVKKNSTKDKERKINTSLLDTSKEGSELLRQFLSQGTKNNNCDMIAIIIPQNIDMGFKSSLKRLAKNENKNIVFIELEQICMLLQQFKSMYIKKYGVDEIPDCIKKIPDVTTGGYK